MLSAASQSTTHARLAGSLNLLGKIALSWIPGQAGDVVLERAAWGEGLGAAHAHQRCLLGRVRARSGA